MVLDLVNDRLNRLYDVVMLVCHSFVNHGSWDIKWAFVRVRIGMVKSFENSVIFEVNWLYIMLIVVFVLKFVMSFMMGKDDFWFRFMVYLFVHSMQNAMMLHFFMDNCWILMNSNERQNSDI